MRGVKTATIGDNLPYYNERVDLACAFRWAVRWNMHEGVANHFSLAVSDDGCEFLLNPNQMHFDLIKASDIILLNSNDKDTMNRPDAPDPTAWGLHGSIHRHCPHARCALHVHSIYATVLACLKDSDMPPIDQNTATFYNRIIIDKHYGGLAFEEEGERCASLFSDPKKKVMIMGNHGVMVIGEDVGDALNRLYYFERAAETLIKAYWTGKDLSILPHDIAEKTARQLEEYPEQGEKHINNLKMLLDKENSDYRE